MEHVKVRDFPGVRDDPDDETFLFHLSDGKADAVDTDRAFRNHVMGKLRWKRYLDTMVPPSRLDGQNFPGSVYVSLNDVAIEPARDWKRTFEIHKVARLQEAKIRPSERLSQKVERDRGHGLADNGQTTTVIGQAVSCLQFLGQWRPDHKFKRSRRPGLTKLLNPSGRFNDPGEHLSGRFTGESVMSMECEFGVPSLAFGVGLGVWLGENLFEPRARSWE
jgi:hypothetical protein